MNRYLARFLCRLDGHITEKQWRSEWFTDPKPHRYRVWVCLRCQAAWRID